MKRSNGEGTIFKNNKTGKWVAQVTYYVGGKRKRKTKSSIRKSDAAEYLKDLHEEVRGGILQGGGDTLGENLNLWVAFIENNAAFNTHRIYKILIDKHINPYIGNIRLDKLTAHEIEVWLQALKDDGVGTSTIQMSFRCLKSYLNRAVKKQKKIKENPCVMVDMPQHKVGKANPFTAEEVKAILKELEHHILYLIYFLAFSTGMRLGEVLGLQWQCIDLDGGTISVEQQLLLKTRELAPPKTESSVREISISPELRAAILDHKKEMLRKGLISSDFVFCDKNGDPINFKRVYTAWRTTLKKCLLDHRGFHQTRHTFATLALSNGANIAVVSKTLGHANTSMTLDIYSHVLEEDRSVATSIVGKLIG
ncbi:tyrosine-type recombinase/integrase [Gimesia maris]|uniref:tyrosine-type recombinase/integrase n=1 Tax=Gimesia maris TaxID=122 RepID=UPI0032ECACE4